MDDKTLLAQAGLCWNDSTGAVSMPIFQTATFRHPAFGASTGFDYSRTNNPTRQTLEQELAALEGASGASAFASGLAALGAVLQLFKPGDHLVLSQDLYGGTYRLMQELFVPYGIEASYVDSGNLRAVESALQKNTRAIFVETPGNPCMSISDLSKIAGLCRKRSLLFIVDNTFMTGFAQKAIGRGADLVVYSGSKYLSGHNDTVCGFVVSASKELDERIKFVQNAYGAILAPFDSWLVMRGMKTLALRMERHSRNAQAIAEFLQTHPAVQSVMYPGLPGHPGAAIHASQALYGGGMIGFRMKDPAQAERVINGVQLISFAESLGGVESLITHPLSQTHAALDEAFRQRVGVDASLLRLSVGIEDVDDLIADLRVALA